MPRRRQRARVDAGAPVANEASTASDERISSSTVVVAPITMAGSAVNMARLIAQGKGFSDLVEPEVPSLVVVPPTEVTADSVSDLRDLCFE